MSQTSRLFRWSGQLFALPSAFTGIARLLDLGHTFTEYNDHDTPEEADRAAMASDWYAVGDDLAEAIRTYRY